MVKAAITPITTRESLIPSDRQLVISSFSNNIDYTQQREREEELKRSYLIQNKILAKKNEDLQIKVRNLENQLFQSQKDVLSLKSEKIQLTEKLKLNSRRFNDIIINSFDNLMNEYHSFMADIGIDIEKKEIPKNLLTKINENVINQNTNIDFAHYWQNINEDLQRRKSCIFQNKKLNLIDVETKETEDDDQLDTLVENVEQENEEEEIKEKVLEPEYEDYVSANIPIKRQSAIMKRLDNCQLTTNVPYLGIPNDDNIEDNEANNKSNNDNDNDNNKINEINNNNDELFNYVEEELPHSPIKSIQKIILDDKNDKSEDKKEHEEREERKTVRRKSKVPRELKNLDTEKTKKWLGMDPLDDVEESTSERRKSRRRSLIVNYQLPSLKQKMRRSSGLFKGKIYIDDDKENRISKPKNKANKNVLRNITNIQNNNNNNHNREKSIFDLENDDIFTRYDSKQGGNGINTNRDEVYDLLL